jgi:hypothetical protein
MSNGLHAKNVFIVPEDVDELAFLFRAQTGPDLDGLCRALSIDLDDLGVLGSLEGVRRGGHD